MSPSWLMLRGSAIGLGGRLVLMVVQLGSHLLLARSLGTAGYGVLSLAIPIVILSTFFARAGLPRTIQKYMSAYRMAGDGPAMKGLYRWTLRWLLIIGITVSVILLLSAGLLETHIFGYEGLAPTILAVSFSVVFANLVFWLGSLALALGRVRLEVLGQHLLQPIAFLVFLLAILVSSSELSPFLAAAAFSASWVITAALIWWHSGGIRSEFSAADSTVTKSREWAVYSYHVSIPDMVNRVRDWVDLIVAGMFLASVPLGILALCLRIAYLPGTILSAFGSIFAHRAGAFSAAGELDELGREYSNVTFSSLSLSAPLIVSFYAMSDWILALFGPDFILGRLTLNILLFGQLVVAVAGPCWFIMVFCGFERTMLRFSLISTAVSIILCVLLIPRFGIVGAGIANMVSLTVLNGAQVIYIQRRLGILAPRLDYLRLVPPLALALVIVLARRSWLPIADPHLDAAITFVLFGAGYVLLAIPFGVWRTGLIGHVLATRTKDV